MYLLSYYYSLSDYTFAFIFLGIIGFILFLIFIHWFISSAVSRGVTNALSECNFVVSNKQVNKDNYVKTVNDYIESQNKNIDK
jgi:hypothetical protein